MLPGDLLARLRWMGEHDRCALVQLLATVEPPALRLALRLVGPDSAAPTKPGPAAPSRQDE